MPHVEVGNALVETLGFRHIGVVKEEYAVSRDGMKLFGVLGYKVFVCENMAFRGNFQPVLAKHSKNFNLVQAVSVGLDEMQRNFDGMRRRAGEQTAKRSTSGPAH